MQAIVWVVLILSTFLATLAAPAQDAKGSVPVRSADETDGIILKRERNSLSAAQLLGTIVVGSGGERVGTVRDLLIDRNGHVTAVTVDVGDFLGIPTKTIALSARSLRFVPATPSGIDGIATSGTSETAADPVGSGRSVFVPGIGMVDHIEIGRTRRELEDAPAFEG